MDFSALEEESEKRARSFRYEAYNNRRVFLRSYPLYWAEQVEEEDDDDVQEHAEATQGMVKVSKRGRTTVFKHRVLYVLRWGEGKVLLLRKLKHKVSFYLVACNPFGMKSSPSLLSV